MKVLNRFFVICFVIVCFFSCDSPKNNQIAIKKDLDSFYSPLNEFKRFPRKVLREVKTYFPPDFQGTYLIYRDGKLFKDAVGYRDINKNEKLKTDDVFQLASVSKTVTAVSVMLLVQEGKIHLDSLVSKYLSDFPYQNVTVRHLLNHRSGLANYMYFTDAFWKDTATYMSNSDFYSFMKENKPAIYADPGRSFSYCNTNFAYLAVLVSKITGLEFHKFVEERIFKPAGMRSSFFHGHKPKRIQSKVLIGRYDQYQYTSTYYMDGILGDKSLYSNVDDLFCFHLALSEGRLLKKEYLNMMQEASYKHNVYGGSYGLGFRLMKTNTGQWTYHNGWWRGFWTSFWNRFDEKTCLIILTNNKKSSHVDKQKLAEYLLQIH